MGDVADGDGGEALPAGDRERRVDDRGAPILGRHPCHGPQTTLVLRNCPITRYHACPPVGTAGEQPSSMIRTTPFHERTSALNETGLWEHWSGHLAAVRYQMSEKFEYFAIRNAAGLFDTSPLYKYRFTGPDAERFLGGVLARDPRQVPRRARPNTRCGATTAASSSRTASSSTSRRTSTSSPPPSRTSRTSSRSRAAWTSRSRTSRATGGSCPSRARARATSSPRSRRRPRSWATSTSRGRSSRACPCSLSRTGYTGDLGFEIWVPAADALKVWDAVWKVSRGQGVIPFGMTALYMARIEAGLVLLDVDFHSSRFAWTDADRSTPIELGLGWMFRDLAPATNGSERRGGETQRRERPRPRVHRRATRSGASSATRPRAGSSPGSSSTGGTTTGSTTARGSSRPRTTRRSRTSTTSTTTS